MFRQMDTGKSIFDDARLSTLAIACVSLLICLLSMMGGELSYPGNDDTFRNLVSAGAFGDLYSYYIPNSNILYGVPAWILNRLLPGVNWYYWIIICLNLISVITICHLTGCRKLYCTILLTLAVNIAFARDFYLAVQYTKCASMWIAVGLAICIMSVQKMEKNSWWIPGVMLFTCGAASRLKCLLLVLPFCIVFCLIHLLRQGKAARAIRWHKVICVISALCCALAILILSEQAFRAVNPAWEQYWQYDTASVALRDYYVADYEDNAAAYNAIHTDDNDISLFRKWIFGDSDFYTIAWLQRVGEISAAHHGNELALTPSVIGETFRQMGEEWAGLPLESQALIILAFCSILTVMIRGGSSGRLQSLLFLCGLFAIYWYFVCRGRLAWRVNSGLYVSIIVFEFLHLRYPGQRKGGKVKSARLITAIACATILLGYTGKMVYQWRYVKDKSLVANEADITGRLLEFRSHPENFYILTDFYVTNNPMSISRSRYDGIYSNSTYGGNWIYPSPDAFYYAGQYGIDNPLGALVDHEHVYLHATNPDLVEMIARHLTRTHGQGVYYRKESDELYQFYMKK